MNIYFLTGVFLLILFPSITNASYFSDTFNRIDNSSTVGNGWSQASAGGSASQGISGNRYFNVGDNNGNNLIFRSDISTTSGVSILVRFNAATMSNRFLNRVVLLSSGNANENLTGYGFTCNGSSSPTP